MSLNIKNERVCALAREAADRTGQTQTAAIESALEEYLARRLKQTREQRLDELLGETRRRIEATGGPLSTDDLYDEFGCPA